MQTGGLPNPELGFPGHFPPNPAEEYAWVMPSGGTTPAPDGIGLQDHYARAWAHVAAFFQGNPGVFGYEVLNEPWPGIIWEGCVDPSFGLPGPGPEADRLLPQGGAGDSRRRPDHAGVLRSRTRCSTRESTPTWAGWWTRRPILIPRLLRHRVGAA